MPYDFKLLEAYQILQDETCPTCGNPIWVCRTSNTNVRFKMESSVCFADRKRDQWEKKKRSVNKNWEPRPGEQWFPKAITHDGGPLPTRDDYIQELNDSMVTG